MSSSCQPQTNLLVFGLASEEGEREGALDVLVAVDGRADGGDDPLTDALVLVRKKVLSKRPPNVNDDQYPWPEIHQNKKALSEGAETASEDRTQPNASKSTLPRVVAIVLQGKTAPRGNRVVKP